MIERHSATWQYVNKWADDQIEAARVRLEAAGLPMDHTERLRGRIAALRDLQALVTSRDEIPVETVDYKV